jgi:hypothetical protein
MQQETVTLIVAGLGICGTLGGIVVGHILSRSAQREHWVLDRRHEEFQEIIRAFDASMLSEATAKDYSMELTPEERRDKARRTTDFFQVIRTRIFTVADIKRLDLDRAWRVAVALYRNSNDGKTFESTYETLMRELVLVATASKVKKGQ